MEKSSINFVLKSKRLRIANISLYYFDQSIDFIMYSYKALDRNLEMKLFWRELNIFLSNSEYGYSKEK